MPERCTFPNPDGTFSEVDLVLDCDIIKLPFPCPDGTLGEVELLHAPDPHYHEREPLNLRGWAMQERLLSPRLLIFGKYEVTWQC